YLTGPNTVECTPIRKSAATSCQRLLERKPHAASDITAISKTFTARAIEDFSSLSASWPAVAEKRKKGRRKSPRSSVASALGSALVRCPARNVTSVMSAVLKTLSLNAPRNCVANSGAKRRWRRRAYWLLIRSASATAPAQGTRGSRG